MNLYINVCYLHMFDIPCCGRYFLESPIYTSGVLFPSDALKHGAVSKLISLNFNVCVVRHCHDKDHRTSQEFTLVWLIIINSAVPLTALHPRSTLPRQTCRAGHCTITLLEVKEFQLLDGCECSLLQNIPAVFNLHVLQQHEELDLPNEAGMRGVISAGEPCSLNRPSTEPVCSRITICYYGSQVDQKSVQKKSFETTGTRSSTCRL